MRFREYGAVSLKRCVLCVRYETSGNPLPSSLAEDYMDQILKKKTLQYYPSNALFAPLSLSNFLSLSFLS